MVGRNEPCPCGSGKKHKRCCGPAAAPRLGEQPPAPESPSEGVFDPALLQRMAEAFKRLPRGQMQRIQGLAQRALSGQDVSREAAELERSLPPGFQELIAGLRPTEAPAATAAAPMEAPSDPPMDVEMARDIVALAVKEGRLPREEGDRLLAGEGSGGLSALWKKLRSG